MKSTVVWGRSLPKVDLGIKRRIKVGSKVSIINADGYFSSHTERKMINGIEPACRENSKYLSGLKGRIMKVLSISEKLQTLDFKNGIYFPMPVIVLTDGKYSYWFGYYGKLYKDAIKLI